METEKEKIFYNALNIVLDSNYAKLSSLREKFPSWEKAFFSLPEEKKKEIEPEKEWEEAKKEKIEMIFKEDALYPNFFNKYNPSSDEMLAHLVKIYNGEKTISSFQNSLKNRLVGLIENASGNIAAYWQDSDRVNKEIDKAIPRKPLRNLSY